MTKSDFVQSIDLYFARRLLAVDVFVIDLDVGFSLLVVLSSSSSISSSRSSFNG